MNQDKTVESTPCGVLLLDKPAGRTSHDMVGWARRQLGIKQVGHAGTLDPMATGVLPVLIGRATKLSPFLSDHDKSYDAVLRLGIQTDSGDIWGHVVKEYSGGSLPSENEVNSVCQKMTGKILQIPPMYSALKQNGQKLVDLARAGIEVPREAREVVIHSLSCSKLTDSDYALSVHCGKGTYIRTLCEDIGSALGCGGTMASLRRTSVGGFQITDCHSPEAIEQMTTDEKNALLIGPEDCFPAWDRIRLPDFYEKLFRNGCSISCKKAHVDSPRGDHALMMDAAGRCYAVADVNQGEEDTELHSACMLII